MASGFCYSSHIDICIGEGVFLAHERLTQHICISHALVAEALFNCNDDYPFCAIQRARFLYHITNTNTLLSLSSKTWQPY